MRIFIFLLLLIICASCDHPKKPYIEELTWPKRTVKLDNDLGVLTIRLPEEFDTSFKWLHVSDNPCSDYKKYRLQSAKFPINMESGFFYNGVLPDSLKMLTIKHTKRNWGCDDDWEVDTNSLKASIHRYNYINDKNGVIPTIAKINKINNRMFIVIGYKNAGTLEFDSNHPSTSYLSGLAKINKQILQVNFECGTSNCDSFIPKMYKALKTVEIKPN